MPEASHTEQFVPVPEPTHALIVESIEWARAQMTIRVVLSELDGAPLRVADSKIDFQLVDALRTVAVPALSAGNGAYDLQVDVTTIAGRSVMPDGTWRVQAILDHEIGPIAVYDGGALKHLDDASRVFLFDSNRSVLTVSYGIAENAGQLDFLMRAFTLKRSPMRSTRRYSPKRLREKLFGAVAKYNIARLIFIIFTRVVGPKKGQILFASDQRERMEGNLLRVHDRMIERGLDKKFTFRTTFRLPKTTHWPTTIRILYLLATSEIVLLDDYFAMLKGLNVSPKTRIIQLWHAGSGFKSVGYSRFGMPGSPSLQDAHRQYTHAITGSTHLVPVYAEVFGIEESAVIPTGLPRVDTFLDEKLTQSFIDAFYTEYPALRDKRIILFAPTYRGRSINSAYYKHELIDFDALYEACGADTVVLFRMHHFVKDAIPIPEQYQDRFFDFSRFKDGLSLLHVTDLLITDYSSIIYEFSLLDRPMLFFAPDEVNYAAIHGFHREYHETAPGRVCRTFDELVEAIKSGEFEQSKVAQFRAENFDNIDTGAADRVINTLILSDPRDNAAISAKSAPLSGS